jgi:pre-mRNA-processing factor 40
VLTRYRGHVAPTRTPEPEEVPVTIPHGGFKNVADAEDAFMYLLKREGIDETWTWDAAMRKVVLDPLFKALETLAQKQTAFEKWQAQLVSEKAAARDARIAELRPKLRRLFAQNGIKSYHTLKTGDKLFAGDKYWRRAKEERRLLLDEYTAELRTHEAAARKQRKEHCITALGKLIKNLDITVATRWHDARDIITRSDAFAADPQLAKMEPLDMLTVYDEYARALEREFDEESRRLRAEARRRARKARDAFRALLRELREQGKLTRTSKWKETLPLIRDEERYTALLGVPGSTPLELWMDAVDDMQLAAEERAAKIEGALKDKVELETTFEDFGTLCMEAGVAASDEAKQEAYDVIHARLAKLAAEEARRAERRRRHRIEDLRDALRRVRGLDAESTYDSALPLIAELPEFKVLEDEDRRAAFEKHARRLKEKESERRGSRDRRMSVDSDRERRRDLWDKERERDRDRDWRDRRDRDRERDRDYGRHRDRPRRERSEDEREAKRRRVSPTSSKAEKEEGEI